MFLCVGLENWTRLLNSPLLVSCFHNIVVSMNMITIILLSFIVIITDVILLLLILRSSSSSSTSSSRNSNSQKKMELYENCFWVFLTKICRFWRLTLPGVHRPVWSHPKVVWKVLQLIMVCVWAKFGLLGKNWTVSWFVVSYQYGRGSWHVASEFTQHE